MISSAKIIFALCCGAPCRSIHPGLIKQALELQGVRSH